MSGLRRYLAVGILLLIILNGCQPQDIDQRLIISSMGMDLAENGLIKTTLKAPSLHEITIHRLVERERSNVIHSEVSPRILPSLIAIQNKEEYGIFLGQCKTVVLGESLARQGIRPILDYLRRTIAIRPSAYLIISASTAEEVLRTDWREEVLHGQSLHRFVTNQKNPLPVTRIWGMYQSIYDSLGDSVVPLVETLEESKNLKILGVALFKNDRMVGRLNAGETTILGYLLNQQYPRKLTVVNDGSDLITIDLIKGRTVIKISGQTRPVIQVKMRYRASIGELGDGNLAVLSGGGVAALEKRIEKNLQQRARAVLEKLQALGSDPLRLGHRFRIKNIRRFPPDEWEKLYKQADYSVEVDISIVQTGVLQ